MTTRDEDNAPSIDAILADIRRRASAARPHAVDDLQHRVARHEPASGGAIDVPATASGSASLFDVAAMDDDALDDHLEDLSQPALGQVGNDSHDLPSILKSPRHCAVVRPAREASGRGLSDALRSAGLLGGTALADGSERSQARWRNPFSTSPAPRETPFVDLDAVAGPPLALPHSPTDCDDATGLPDAPNHPPPDGLDEFQPAPAGEAGEMCPPGSHALVLDAATLAQALEIDLIRSFRYRHGGAADPDAADDGAADLLRPMLRRWIDENMPRLIEVALDRELSRAHPVSGYNRAG